MDQLIFKSISSDCEAVLNFLSFIPIDEYSSEYLAETVTNYIEEIGLHISDCCGQSYDNARGTLQFFSRFSDHWKLLTSKMKKQEDYFTLKSRANTRWCANAAAMKAIGRVHFKQSLWGAPPRLPLR